MSIFLNNIQAVSAHIHLRENVSLTYNSYLKIDELLGLQELKSSPPEHDEMLFIVIHQTYELWFKQILHELELFNSHLESGKTWGAMKTMRRVLTILKTLVSQVDILETMTPLEFNQFRKFLENSSGFQSVQFREVEILCGMRSPHMLIIHPEGSEYRLRLEKRAEQRTIWETFCYMLQRAGFDIETPVRENERGLVYNASDHNQGVLVTDVLQNPELSMLSELLVDFDEGLQEWRYRHVKMVERTIGTRTGTGGSDGVEYLKRTLHQQVFPDLWAIRARF
jgi:tryptophan 2,3-dioxygenase